MRSTFALIHASWRAAASYRLRLLLSLASLGATVVPLYFIANALQPVMAESIEAQGGQYFGFLIVGMVTFLLLPTAINSLPAEIGSGISTGVLEMLLATPARATSIFSGMIGFSLLWTTARAAALLLAGWLLGAELIWSQIAADLRTAGPPGDAAGRLCVPGGAARSRRARRIHHRPYGRRRAGARRCDPVLSTSRYACALLVAIDPPSRD